MTGFRVSPSRSRGWKGFILNRVGIKFFALLACFCLVLCGTIGLAKAAPVQVVSRNIEPFSFSKDGIRTGFSVELWDDIAKELSLSSTYSIAANAKAMIRDVETGKADVAVGALSITSEREKQVDFSQPFFQSGLQVLVKSQPSGASSIFSAIATNLLTWQMASGLAGALIVMFFISHLVWKYEHPVNEEMWPKSYWSGIGESFWWTISIFLVGGADNKGPIGKGGRIVATLWMITSVIAVSLLTASLSAVLTVNALPGDINGPDDLYGRTVATVEGSVAQSWLEDQVNPSGQRILVKTYPDVQASINSLRSGLTKAVVYDAPILNYYLLKDNDTSLALVGDLFERADYGFALKNGSPLIEPINQAMLDLKERGVIDRLRSKWFGS
jgi:hypothetical protein